MEPVKSSAVQAPKAPEAPKRVTERAKPQAQAEVIAAKKPAEPAPRTTTNTRGETLGRHLNVTA